jgi:E3 ubiquitin-protein ligase HERC2
VEDLFSPHFDLFAPCPNARHAAGQNNEKYVPNIRHNGMLAMAQLRFVGRLMGMSLRTHLCLPFELPSLVWKKLLGQHVGLEDLRAIDTIACQFLSAIRDCGGDGITDEAAFRDVYGEKLFFTYTGSDGAERELLEGGSSRRVTFDDRLQYCDLVQRHRLHEFDTHIAAITKGLQEVVPLNSLRLYTAQQAEVAFAGEPHFDLDWWRAHTDYKGFAEDDLTVELFWKVLESFSPQDKSGFVRFAWARSRLPPKAYWTCNMKLSNRGAEQLPQSHTCFFSVELPEYKTEEEMRQGLLTAIHCSSGILNV